jgi:hypothetical protein
MKWLKVCLRQWTRYLVSKHLKFSEQKADLCVANTSGPWAEWASKTRCVFSMRPIFS